MLEEDVFENKRGVSSMLDETPHKPVKGVVERSRVAAEKAKTSV